MFSKNTVELPLKDSDHMAFSTGADSFRTDEALLLYSQISALPEPRQCNVACFREWIKHDGYGNSSIDDNGRKFWGENPLNQEVPTRSKVAREFLRATLCPWPRSADGESVDSSKLAAMRPPGKMDGLARWIQEDLIPLREKWRQADASRGVGSSLRNLFSPATEKGALPAYGDPGMRMPSVSTVYKYDDMDRSARSCSVRSAHT